MCLFPNKLAVLIILWKIKIISTDNKIDINVILKETIDKIDDGIYAQEKLANEIWDQYEDFNEALFRKKFNETADLIKNTTDLKNEINE